MAHTDAELLDRLIRRDADTLKLVAGEHARPLCRGARAKMRLMMCGACRRFAAQMEAIRRGAASTRQLFDGETHDIETRAAQAKSRGEDA